MVGPSLSPLPPRGTLGQANTSGPTYFDVNGKPINTIQCGGAFTFDVPGSGLTSIWLTIYKNGQKTYDGLYTIPMPSYITSCESDIGQYQVVAYDPASGIALGQTQMAITPAGGGPVPGGGGTPAPGGGILSWFSNLSTGAKVGIAAGLGYFLYKRAK